MMNKNKKNKVILGQDDSLEPRNSAESRNCHPRACNARTETRSLRRSAKGKLSRFFNLIRRSLEFFAFAKNRDDSLLFSALPRTHFLAMTPSTLALAAVLTMGLISESRAETFYYDDFGRLSGIYDGYSNHGFTINYDSNDKIETIYEDVYASGNLSEQGKTDISVRNNSDGSLLFVATDGSDEAYVVSNKGILLQKGTYSFSNGGWSSTTVYSHDSKTGAIIGGKSYSCGYITNISECTQQSEFEYTNEYDKYGNIIKSYAGSSIERSFSYTDTYLAKQAANESSQNDDTRTNESDCYASGQVYWDNACVDEYPFAKKHWTPAEAAQYLKDTDNTIIMTFKVNR